MAKYCVIAMLLIGLVSGTAVASQRMVVAEEYTSTTCPPCASASPALTVMATKYIKNLTLVRYHMNWPSPYNDPYYAANSTENTARRTFYNVNAVPHMVIDGDTLLYAHAHDYSYWDGLIAGRIGVSSPVDLSFVTVYDTASRTGTVTWTAKATAAVSQTNLKLRMAITESDLWYTGTNGDPVHHEVMRDMVADANGDTLTLVTAGDSITRSKTFAINSGWVAKNCQIVLWTQTDTWSGRTKQMLQGAKEYFGSKLVQTGVSTSTIGKEFFLFMPGDMVNLTVSVQNQGGPGMNASCDISTTSPYITTGPDTWTIGSLGLGDTLTNASNPLTFSIDPATPNGHRASIIIQKHITNQLTGYATTTVDTLKLVVGTATSFFMETFESGYANWARGGTGGSANWDTTSATYHSAGHSITDSRSGNYANSVNRYIRMLNGVNLTPYSTAVLSWWERYATEDGYDFCYPEYSLDGSNWYVLLPQYSGSNTTWSKRLVDISDYCAAGATFRVRFRITSDTYVVADGWYVDDVAIDVYLPTGVAGGPTAVPTPRTALLPISPNPAFGALRFAYDLAAPGKVSLGVYDIMGRLVARVVDGNAPAGHHAVSWNGADRNGQRIASGVYFVRLDTDSGTQTRRVTVIR